MTKEIKVETKYIAGSNYIVTNPEVVKVKVIKQKYIDQMLDLHEMLRSNEPINLLESNIRFIGCTGQTVVLIYNGEFRATQKMDLDKKYTEELLASKADDYVAARKMAGDIIDAIPQMFRD